jgi:ribosomal protein L37AE/L43A
MQALLNRPPQRLARPKTGKKESTAIHSRHSMMSKHTCPCCSYTLLRHLRLGGLYWRCSHCYQEMPVL